MKISIALCFILFSFQSNEYSSKVIGNQKDGWGYAIYKNSRLIINQDIIPGVRGNQRFKNQIDARKVADLVVSKFITKPKNSPFISRKELDSLKINYNK